MSVSRVSEARKARCFQAVATFSTTERMKGYQVSVVGDRIGVVAGFPQYLSVWRFLTVEVLLKVLCGVRILIKAGRKHLTSFSISVGGPQHPDLCESLSRAQEANRWGCF